MNKQWRLIFLAMILFFCHFALSHWVAVAGVSPDFLFLILLVFLTGRSRKTMIFLGLLLGFIQDVSVGGWIGCLMLSKTAAGFLMKTLYNKDQPPSFFIYSLVLVFSMTVHEMIRLACLNESFHDWAFGMLRYGMPIVLYTAVTGSLMYFLLYSRYFREFD